MLPDNVRRFVTENHQGVLTCFRRNGAAQMSIVTTGAYQDGVAFTTTEDRAKLHNLRRNPRCSLLISHTDWRPFVVLEGTARILSPDNTDPEVIREALRDVYRAAAGRSTRTGKNTTRPWPLTAGRPSLWRQTMSTAPWSRTQQSLSTPTFVMSGAGGFSEVAGGPIHDPSTALHSAVLRSASLRTNGTGSRYVLSWATPCEEGIFITFTWMGFTGMAGDYCWQLGQK